MSLCATFTLPAFDVCYHKQVCSCFITAGTQKESREEGEGISLMKSFLGCWAQYNLSDDEHYAFMLSFMLSQEGDL